MFVEQLNNIVNYDVQVTNVYKSYETNNMILNGFNMKVAAGSIYGLLGPSGCGKSTLFQCILGTLPLDSGNIELNAQSLNDIGYMPQDLCIDTNLTIKETFEFYGKIYSMRQIHITKRIDELTEVLKLPDLNSLINKLSGGQCRRISLAISILHDPKIIFMDEPTVGVDSLLRHEIWKAFSNMVAQQKKTIIITTHYIEEASEADCIGLMRNGVLVEEGSPQFILAKYNTDTLESAFLKLCCNQNENHIVHNGTVRVNNDKTIPQPKNITKLKNKFKFIRVKALMKKYLHSFSRDYVLMFTMFILPILQALIICNCVGTGISDLNIAIKNDEIDFWGSRRSNIDGCILNEKNDQKISGVIMNRLQSLGYTLDEVADRNTGEMIMSNSSKYIAFIHFPENYTRSFTKFINDRDNYDYQSQAYVNYDTYNVVYKYKIIFDLRNTLVHITEDILNGCSYNTKALSPPMDFSITDGKDVKSHTNSIAAFFVVMGSYYFPCVFSLSIIITERMDGILMRSMFAGVKIVELVISLFALASIIVIIQMIIPVIIAYVWYQNPIQVTNGLVAYEVLMIFAGWTGFFYGILVACISPNRLTGDTLTNGVFFIQTLLSGAVWPIESQPPLLRMVTELLPMRLAGNVMTNIALKGWTLEHPSVIKNIVVMFSYSVILVLVIIGLGKFKKNMWIMQK